MGGQEKKCEGCGDKFYTTYSHKEYCGKKCRGLDYRRRMGREIIGTTIPSGTTGAISELVVSADLMGKGWAVFRAMSPSCFCDLVAVDGQNHIKRIEVRTGYRSQVSGKVSYPKQRNGEIDLFGVVDRNSRQVWYIDLDGNEVSLWEGE